jgi:hypothetical protein
MLSKTLFAALVATTVGSGACTSTTPDGAPNAREHTAAAQSPQVATLACTPVGFTGVTAQVPFITCGATAATGIALASSVQATLATQMQSAFSTLVLTPDFTANQVAITSQAAAFSSFFGTQIVAPLTAGGVFSVAAPLTLGTFAPNVTLTANVFGAVPFVGTPLAAAAPLTLGVGGADPITTFNNANGSFGSFNSAAFTTAATNTAAMNTAAVSAATMPMTILISSPLTATAPLVCSGAISLGCL